MVSAAPFVRLTLPPVVFVALKLLTTFAPPSVVPPTELVVSVPVVLISPEPFSEIAPVSVSVTFPAPALTVPVIVVPPALFTATVPPPVWLIPVVVSAAPFVRLMLPLVVFVALKLLTRFAPPRIASPTELVVRVPVVLINPEPLSEIAQVSVSVTFPAPALTVPVIVVPPALFTATVPPPAWLIPVIVSAAPFFRVTLPLVVFVALKLLTRFAPPRIASPTELVVRVPVVLINPEPLSEIAPVSVNVTFPAPALTVPVIVVPPALFTATVPPPVWLIPVIVSAAPFFRLTLPLVVFEALKLLTTFAPPRIASPTELVVRVPVVLISPEPLSEIAPVSVSVTSPAPALTVPVIVVPPALFTATVPPPALLSPVID